MKRWTFLSVLTLTLNLQAANTLTVIGPCSEKPVYEVSADSPTSTLGDFTVDILQKNQIPFQGDRSGIKAIFDSPTGDEALEILSDSQMRAYGWCVTVNGLQPGRMPDEVPLTGSGNHIVWFYAFAFYDKGEWKSFCTPSHTVRSPQICKHQP